MRKELAERRAGRPRRKLDRKGLQVTVCGQHGALRLKFSSLCCPVYGIFEFLGKPVTLATQVWCFWDVKQRIKWHDMNQE